MVSNVVSNRDIKFIQYASQEATKSPCLMKHGCVIVANGRVVGRGYNHYRNTSKDGFIHDCFTCHAEISALRQAHKRSVNFKRATLYVCRVDANERLQTSSPCAHCMDTIRLLNVKRMVYSVDENDVVTCKPELYVTDHISHGNKMKKSTNRPIHHHGANIQA